MSRIEDQCLLIRHFGQVFHGQPVLGPVLENGTVPSIGDQLIRVLGHHMVQVVGEHQHDGTCLHGPVGERIQVACGDLIPGSVTIHIDPAVLFKFVSELFYQ